MNDVSVSTKVHRFFQMMSVLSAKYQDLEHDCHTLFFFIEAH